MFVAYVPPAWSFLIGDVASEQRPVSIHCCLVRLADERQPYWLILGLYFLTACHRGQCGGLTPLRRLLVRILRGSRLTEVGEICLSALGRMYRTFSNPVLYALERFAKV